jgi:hypothetical protein
VGVDCTFTGCVPSKTLLAAAARGDNFGDAMAAVLRAVARIAATEDDMALEREGLAVIHGRADTSKVTAGLAALPGGRRRVRSCPIVAGTPTCCMPCRIERPP